jgi:hypothetical protein
MCVWLVILFGDLKMHGTTDHKDRNCTYNVTLMRGVITIVASVKAINITYSVCVSVALYNI